MYPQIHQLIEKAISEGVPPHLISEHLIEAGWPPSLVNQALQSWLENQGKIKKSTALKDWLKKYQKRAAPAIAVVVTLNLIDTAIALLKPWPTKIMADSVFGDIPAWGPLSGLEGTPQLLLITSLMTISLFILGAVFGVFRDFYLVKIGYWLNRSIKQESLRHILHLPLFHQERLSKGDYVYRQNVVTDSLSDLVLGTTSSIIQSILVIIGVLAIMMNINPGLSIITIFLIPLLFISIKLIGPKMGQYAQKFTEIASETSSRITESINNAETIQAFTLEEKMVSKIDNLWQKSYHYMRKNMLWAELLDNGNGFLVVSATSLVMFLGGSAVLRNEITFGDLIIFMTYMGYLIDPVQNLIGQITTRNQKLIDVGRIYEVLTDHEGIEDLRVDNHMPNQIKGTIEFNNVTYAYKDQIVFKDLNFTIPAGQKVGIIGPSGGGKSTILKLLPLFIEPSAGNITIDGISIDSVSLKELRQHIGWVSQTPQLFDENIFENLLEGDITREITNEEIEYAVDVSNITEFVIKMPLAFESPVGEDGGSLSGGQRQRLSIARALVKNAPILCLDEPTAALDVKSENYIRDSLAEMVKGKTVVMVTHRKPLLALMDIILVLEDGKLNDVRNLGGLDAYLERLEGIEHEEAQQEIYRESQDVDINVISNFLEFYKQYTQAQPTETMTTAEQDRTFMINQHDQEIITQAPQEIVGSELSQQKSTEQSSGDMDKDGEVTINLH